MVWWPFATKPERADTLEVTDLHSGAPPLYSTHFVVSHPRASMAYGVPPGRRASRRARTPWGSKRASFCFRSAAAPAFLDWRYVSTSVVRRR